jgi:hypothetical protein
MANLEYMKVGPTGILLIANNSDVVSKFLHGQTQYISYNDLSGLVSSTGSFQSLTGRTGSFQSLTGGMGSFQSLTGGTGSFQSLNAVTGSFQSLNAVTGSFQSLTGGTGSFQSLTGGTGSFQTLNAVTGFFQSLTGGTGSFQSLTGGTGSFQSLNAVTGSFQSLTGGTGSFQSLTGGTGSFQSLNAVTGSFQSLTVANQNISLLSGGTGSFQSLTGGTGSFQSLTGGTGSFQSVSVVTGSFQSVTGGTGSFQNLSLNSTGIYLGKNVGETGSVNIGFQAGRYNSGNYSINIGYNSGVTGNNQNNIILNASEKSLNIANGPTGGFYVNPIASSSGMSGPFTLLAYGSDNQIVQVTGSIITNMGIGGGGSNDSWILSNFINSPPSVSLTLDKTTTTDVYIIFNYPTQIYSGLISSGLLPIINNLYINLYYNGIDQDTSSFTNGGSTYSVTGSNYLNTSNTTNFIATTTPINSSNIVQCINISKSTSTGLQNNLYKSLKTYTINYSSLTPGQIAKFYLWYSNFNPNVSNSISSLTFSFNSPKNPTQVTNLTITPSTTSQTITISFLGSSQIDSGDSSSTASLNYAILYQPIDGSNKYRYYGTYNSSSIFSGPTLGPFSSPGGSKTQDISNNIYPDTSYYVTINASNTNYASFTGTTGTSITETTGPALQNPIGNGQNNLTTNLISAKRVYTGIETTNILASSSNVSQLNFTTSYNIHNNYVSRGSTGLNLVSFTSGLQGFPGGDITGPNYSLNGFSGSYNYQSSTTNNITITPNISDTYQAGSGYDGYYLKSDIGISMTSANLKLIPNEYTLSVTGTYASNNSGNIYQSFRKFYYDGEQITPNILGFTGIFVSTSCIQICGVTGIRSDTSSTISLSTNVTEIGNYFYNNTQILKYSNTQFSFINPETEVNLTKLTTGLGPTGFKNSNIFVNDSVTCTPNNSYYNGTLTYGVNVYNVVGTQTNGTFSDNRNYLIFDQNLINATNIQRIGGPTNIPLMGTTDVPGIRISTCNPGFEGATGPNNSLNNLTNNGTSYSLLNPLFDHTKTLVSGSGSNELLTWTNGQGNVVHQSLGTAGTNGYINYTNSYYGNNLTNSVNYSTISNSNYRWATFAWRIPTNTISSLAVGSSYQTLVFKFINNSSNFTISNGIATIGGASFYFYYRVEDSSRSTTVKPITTISNYTVISTPWINGNNNSTPLIGSDVDDLKAFNGSKGITTSGQFSVLSGGYSLSNSNYTDNMYVYCRIGIPMNIQFSFSGISCYLAP